MLENRHLKYVFRAQPSGQQFGLLTMNFINQNAKDKLGKDPKDLRVAIIHEDGPYGVDVSKGNEAGAKKAGFNIVLKEGYSATAPDLSALVTKLKRARPDVIFHTGYNPDITLLLHQAREQGLKIAALVSPANCTYLHVADRAGLAPFFGSVDTVIGRFFWIHQNFQLAGWNLEFLAHFLKPGGRLYADFYWPNPKMEQAVVFPPDHALSKAYPSATFRYAPEDVRRLIAGRPFRVLREEISPELQRRYVTFERLPEP